MDLWIHFKELKKIMQEKVSNENLSRRVIKGGFWVFLLRIVRQFLSFGKLITLARILSPDDFGLLGIALLTMGILETFSQTGFCQALIQKKEDISSYLNATWTFLIFRGFILFIILYFIAPYVAFFFEATEVKLIIQVTSLSVLIQPFTNIGIIYFKKELEFNKQFIYQLSGTLADFVVSVSAVLILKNVWALVLGTLAGNIIHCVVGYVLHPYRPHFRLDLDKIKELWSFGKWMLGSSILVFILIHGDDIFVGKLLGAAALGLYQMAYRISNMPATEITHVISQVTYPAYSKLQDDIPRLREAYLKVLQLTAFLSFPIAGSIFVLAPDFTRIFLGEKWMTIVSSMKILVWWGVIRGLVGATSPVFLAIGTPKVVTKFQGIQALLLFILIYPLTVSFDILGTSLAVLFGAMSMFFIRNYMLIDALQCKIWNFYKLVFVPLVATGASIFAIIYLETFIETVKLQHFLLLVLIFALVYMCLSYAGYKLLGIRAPISGTVWKAYNEKRRRY